MTCPMYHHKRGDTFSLGGTVAGLPAGTVTARAQLRDPRTNAKVTDLTVTVGAYVDSVTPRTILLDAPSVDPASWPIASLNGDIEFAEPGGLRISSQTFTVKVLADVTMPPYPSAPPPAPSVLPLFAAAVARVGAGTSRAKVAVVGDSIDTGIFWNSPAQSATYCQQGSLAALLADSLAAAGYPTAKGSAWGDNNQGDGTNALPYDPRVVEFTNGHYDTNPSDNWTLGAHYFFCEGNASNAWKFAPGSVFDTIDVYYVQTSGLATLQVYVDGDGSHLLGSANTSGSDALVKLTATCALGVHVVNLVCSGTPSVAIVGVNCYNSAAKAIDFFNVAAGGAKSADFTTTTKPWSTLNALGFIAPDLTIICLVTNDAILSSPISVTAYKANLQAIITKAKLSGDVLLLTGTPVNSANWTTNGPVFNQAVRDLGTLNGAPVVDIAADFVSYSSALGRGLMFSPEDTHPSRVGLLRRAALVAPLLTV